jgi:hypothetical protein
MSEDQAQTPADPAGVAQDAPAATPAPEVAQSAPDASQAAPEPLADVLEGGPKEPLKPEATQAELGTAYGEFEDAEPVSNPNALRGVPAGPAPHPRTV